MLKNVIPSFFILCCVTTLFAGGNLGLFKKQNGRLTEKASVSFIDFDLKKKEMDGELNGKKIIIHYGKMTWNKESGAYGKPAEVPVHILKPVHEKKRLIPVGQYFPTADGQFYFAVEKIEVNYILNDLFFVMLLHKKQKSGVSAQSRP